MKLMGEAKKANMPFYDLVNLLGNFATRVTMDAKNFAMGLLNTKQRKLSPLKLSSKMHKTN